MNFDQICGFVKFVIFCVIDHPGGICSWNIDISSELKWYVIDFVSELTVSGTSILLMYLMKLIIDVLSHIQHLKYLNEIGNDNYRDRNSVNGF